MRAESLLKQKVPEVKSSGLSCCFIYAMFSSAFMNFGLLGMNM